MNYGEAIRQLMRSERGRQALSDLAQMLENGGNGLDSENQKAVMVFLAVEFRWQKPEDSK